MEREQQQAEYPLLVAQSLDETIFYSVVDPWCDHRFHIPELGGRQFIRGCFHGWVILSHDHDVEWSLWNPLTSSFIHLPPLILEVNDICRCCLSSPPNATANANDPASILLLLRRGTPNIVFCRLDQPERRWTEMSYDEQLRSLSPDPDPDPDDLLISLVCCNGKVYAKSIRCSIFEIEIVVKEEEVVISLLPFVDCPLLDAYESHLWKLEVHGFLKGSSQQLFYVDVDYMMKERKPVDVSLFKLDMSRMEWVQMEELESDTVFLMDATLGSLVNSSPPIAVGSELGGYVHILHKSGKAMYSYHVRHKTMSLSCLDIPARSTTLISVCPMPGFRLQGDEDKCKADYKEDEQGTIQEEDKISMVVRNEELQNEEADLLNIIPFHVLEMMMEEFCVGVDYLNFRATCKRCRLAAPLARWRTNGRRFSPWLVGFDKDSGIITFRDPMFDDKYFIKAASPEVINCRRVLCSKYGWLLLYVSFLHVAFFNPFTGDIRTLPELHYPSIDSFCFSAPPTSPDCMVVGFLATDRLNVYIHFVAREPASWRWMRFDFGGVPSHPLRFPTFHGRDVYALYNEGGVDVFRAIGDDINFDWEEVIEAAPESACVASREYYQVKCDDHEPLLVMTGEFGESVEVWKLKGEDKWEKMDDLGRHTIYICDETCLCMDAKIPEMANKIYFSRLHSGNGKILFYSLETRMYHTFDGRNVGQCVNNFFGTKHLTCPQAWIEPSWF